MDKRDAGEAKSKEEILRNLENWKAKHDKNDDIDLSDEDYFDMG